MISVFSRLDSPYERLNDALQVLCIREKCERLNDTLHVYRKKCERLNNTLVYGMKSKRLNDAGRNVGEV